MDRARAELREYGRSLQRLLFALDSGADVAQIERVLEQANSAQQCASRALSQFSPAELDALADELGDLRRWLALAHDKARTDHARVGESLAEVARARQALTDMDRRPTGESCDVAG